MSNTTTIRECTPKGAQHREFLIVSEHLNPYLLITDTNGSKGVDLFTGRMLFQYRAPQKQYDIITGLYSAISACSTVEEVKSMLFAMSRQTEAEK